MSCRRYEPLGSSPGPPAIRSLADQAIQRMRVSATRRNMAEAMHLPATILDRSRRLLPHRGLADAAHPMEKREIWDENRGRNPQLTELWGHKFPCMRKKSERYRKTEMLLRWTFNVRSR